MEQSPPPPVISLPGCAKFLKPHLPLSPQTKVQHRLRSSDTCVLIYNECLVCARPVSGAMSKAELLLPCCLYVGAWRKETPSKSTDKQPISHRGKCYEECRGEAGEVECGWEGRSWRGWCRKGAFLTSTEICSSVSHLKKINKRESGFWGKRAREKERKEIYLPGADVPFTSIALQIMLG